MRRATSAISSAVEREQAEDPRARPAPGRALDDRHDERRHRRGEQARAEEVGPLGVRVANLAQDAPAGDQARQADGDVDDEHPAPAHLHQQAAERRSRGGGDPADGRPDADRDVALLGRELRQQQPERGRHQQRRAEPLDRARGDEERDRRRQRAGGRGGHEQRPCRAGRSACARTCPTSAPRRSGTRRTRSCRSSRPTTAI